MQLYLVRHGESLGNKKKLFYGSNDYPLTDKGIKDAVESANKIRDIHVHKIYTSGLQRAYQTAEICALGRQVEIIQDPRFNERGLGVYEGKDYHQLHKEFGEDVNLFLQNWTTMAPPGGETFEEFSSRVIEGLREVIRADEDALIVSHHGTMRIIFMELLALGESVTNFFFHQGVYSQIGVIQHGNYLMCCNK